ncbi:MAG: glycerophosphodiester phosphodiesterase [Pirellulaceae bacterium]
MTNPLSAQLIVAHRGASHDAPENTLTAFHLAWEQQADGIECDFRMTADGHIVCIHDETTERTAGTNLEVAGSTLEELQQLDVGKWKGPEFTGERIPLLSEVIAIVPADKRIVIELKAGQEIVAPLGQVLAESNLQTEQILVISFRWDTIAAVNSQLPHLRTHLLRDYEPEGDTGPWTPTSSEIATTIERIGADGLGSEGRRSVFTREFRDALVDEGVEEFHVWTIDDPEDAKFFQELGAWGITTNRPALIRQSLTGDR